MDRDEMRNLAESAKAELAKIKAADTPENESRLISLLAKFGVQVKRLKLKSPERYKLILPDGGGSLERLSLLDLEHFSLKFTDPTN